MAPPDHAGRTFVPNRMRTSGQEPDDHRANVMARPSDPAQFAVVNGSKGEMSLSLWR
jgi:hypothetical protein